MKQIDKKSLAYSSSFAGIYGGFRSLQFIDNISDELDAKTIKRLKYVLGKSCTLYADIEHKVTDGPLKRWVLEMARHRLMELVDQSNFVDKRVDSAARNFIATRCKLMMDDLTDGRRFKVSEKAIKRNITEGKQ